MCQKIYFLLVLVKFKIYNTPKKTLFYLLILNLKFYLRRKFE